MNSDNSAAPARDTVADIRHSRIVELVILLDSHLEENKDIDGIADKLEAILDEQTDDESQRTLEYFERRVVRGELPSDVLIYVDYTRVKIARAYRNAFAFLDEKCPTKLGRAAARSGAITTEAGKEMRRLLDGMRDPHAAPLAQALARFL